MATTNDNPQIVATLSGNYARAILELADQAGTLDEVVDELAQIAPLLRDDPQISTLLAGHQLSLSQRRETLEKVFGGRVSDLTDRFLHVLADKDRLGLIPAIYHALDQLLKARRGEVDVEVASAHPLNTAQLAQVSAQVSAALGKNAILRPRVDPSLLGGLRIKVGDALIDGTLSTQLRRMREAIIAKGQEVVRVTALE